MTYTLLWTLWILAFVVIEGAAIANTQPGDTLSESFWRWFSIKDKGRAWRLRRIVLLAFLVWLCAHFLTGGVFAQTTEARTFHRITIAALATSHETHIEVVGRVAYVAKEADGDLHIRLVSGTLDGNPDEPFVVCEQIPELPIRWARRPKVGDTIKVRGIRRFDDAPNHGWFEIHPILYGEILIAVAPL